MNEHSEDATELLATVGFVVLSQLEEDGELWISRISFLPATRASAVLRRVIFDTVPFRQAMGPSIQNLILLLYQDCPASPRGQT